MKPTITKSILNSAIVLVTLVTAISISTTCQLKAQCSVSISSFTNPTCAGISDGSATVVATGGTGPYTYSWNNTGATTTYVTGLGQGPNVVTVIDAAACTTSVDAYMQEPAPIDGGTISGNQTICSGSAPAAITDILSPFGGSGTNTYTWKQSTDGGTTYTVINGANSLNFSPPSLTVQTFYRRMFMNACGSAFSNTTVVYINPMPVVSASNSSPACAGGSVSLLASFSGGALSWAGPVGFSSTSSNPIINGVSPANSGTYTLTENLNGCSASATTTVTILSNPIATASNTSPVCEGGSFTLSAANSGGATYAWTGPNGYSATQQNPAISNAQAIMAGIYTLTVTSSGCTATNTTNVIVNPLPIVTPTNNGPICEGDTIMLFTSYVSGGSPYAWSGPNGFTEINQNPFVSTNAQSSMAGVYTLTATSTAGCVNTATTSVIVNSLPVATAINNGPVCEGTSLDLTCVEGMIAYSWAGPNGYLNTDCAQSISVSQNATVDMAGVYTLTVSDGNCSNSFTTTAFVNFKPVSNAGANVTVCEGDDFALNGSISVASGGIWSTTGTGIFNPNSTTLNNTYTPSSGDISFGSVLITLTSTGNGLCNAVVDSLFATINLKPIIAAVTSSNLVCSDSIITMSASGATTYAWSPNTGLSSTVGNTVNATINSTIVYTVVGTNANTCTNSDTLMITNKTSSNLSGNIKVAGNSVNQGRVALFLKDTSQIPKPTALSLIDASGNYSFTNIPSGNYLVRAVVDSITYPNAIPTYAGDDFRWDSSDVWSVQCGYNETININIIDLTPPSIAGAIISGVIWDDSDTSTSNKGIRKPGEPIKGVGIIIQRRPGGNASMRTTSDTITGHYQFDNVDTGSYDMYIEMPSGTMLNTYAIDVNTPSDVFTNNDFYVDSTSGKIDTTNRNNVDSVFATRVVTSIGAEGFSMNIFPVPLTENSILVINSKNQSSVTILIEDQVGRSINNLKNISLNKGENKIHLNDLDKFSPGIYFITIKGNDVNSILRIVK